MKEADIPVDWVIKFNNEENTEGLSCDFFVPDSSSDLKIPRKKQMQALKFLKEIQDGCKIAKQDCQDVLERKNTEPYGEQILNITDEIKSLFEIIKEFSKLIRDFDQDLGDSPEKKS